MSFCKLIRNEGKKKEKKGSGLAFCLFKAKRGQV